MQGPTSDMEGTLWKWTNYFSGIYVLFSDNFISLCYDIDIIKATRLLFFTPYVSEKPRLGVILSFCLYFIGVSIVTV